MAEQGNIFEGGGAEQYEIIRPFLDRVDSIREDDQGGYIEAFGREVRAALAARAEKEASPAWAVDAEDYRMKSEIVVMAAMFQASYRSIGVRTFGVQPETIHEGGAVGGPGFISLVEGVYRHLKGLASQRGLDLRLLHLQVLRMVGGIPQSGLDSFLQQARLEGHDYN